MLRLFDYIFYTLYIYFKSRGDEFPKVSGSILLSLIQLTTLLNLLSIFNVESLVPQPPSKLYYLPIILFIGIINWIRYERKEDIDKAFHRWKNDGKGKINAYLILSYLAISVLIILLL